jgi:hypothetical protein
MKWRDYLLENVWVWAGTGLVLLTLTGTTLIQAVVLTSLAVLLHLALTTATGGESDE